MDAINTGHPKQINSSMDYRSFIDCFQQLHYDIVKLSHLSLRYFAGRNRF